MRLIDADSITFESNEFDTYNDYLTAFDAVDKAETINPWHYPSKGELPEKDGDYLCLHKYNDTIYPDVGRYNAYNKRWYGRITGISWTVEPMCWQYIMPPED